ncbi:RNase HII [Actinopolyspora lacussalsi subsp. righensis]|uniref:Ribonuclease HII n=1 Tax=Actinopolyspora righensis TaxID=995060 RepID=A0A1I7C8A2_9ACTN|nr:ribonuclease HII [Actinopolyspora righensis]SFT95622.1 RNase HII [Actinopolyspora righensis]
MRNKSAELGLPRTIVRRDSGSWALQNALERRGLGPVAGVDEAGRGACAGPLVVAACVLRAGSGRRFDGLTDSKLLTARARDHWFEIVRASAVGYCVVSVEPAEVDAMGVHVANLEGMRRAVAGLGVHPGYVLTDGFRVEGLAAPSVAVRKGDRAAGCVAAASVLAKVSRDRKMNELHVSCPEYGFDVHKGYSTARHTSALRLHGPTTEHRWSYSNVVEAAVTHGMRSPRGNSSESGLFDAFDQAVMDNGSAAIGHPWTDQ